MLRLAPYKPKDRFDVYRFFNGISDEERAELDDRRFRVPPVKTFLLEHVAKGGNRLNKSPAEIFQRLGGHVTRLDESFFGLTFAITDSETKQVVEATTGFLEQYDDRFFAYYTCEDAVSAKKRVTSWIQRPDLDAAWYSGPLLQALWDKDVAGRGDALFGKLLFNHESIYDMPEDSTLGQTDRELSSELDGEGDGDNENVEDRFEPERRKARFVMKDRIGEISQVLKQLQRDYYPLYALYGLRLPSRLGRGGHDLSQMGQVTNHSASFEDHRNTVRYLYRIYKSVLRSTEDSAWGQMAEEKLLRTGSKGVPLIVKFDEPLSEATFRRWIHLAFQKRNQFRLWGEPIALGPKKVHVYGADRHLWQPINLEITSKEVVAILPQGTCGNTFHRLVANIQHYVSPKIQAYLGAEPFDSLVSKWTPESDCSSEDQR